MLQGFLSVQTDGHRPQVILRTNQTAAFNYWKGLMNDNDRWMMSCSLLHFVYIVYFDFNKTIVAIEVFFSCIHSFIYIQGESKLHDATHPILDSLHLFAPCQS